MYKVNIVNVSDSLVPQIVSREKVNGLQKS